MVFGVTDGVSTPEEGRELVSWAVKLMSPSPSYPIRGAFDLNKERLVFGVTDGVSTPEEGKELVSRAARLMSLSPDYSIRRAFDFE